MKLFGSFEVPFSAPPIDLGRKRELFLFQKKAGIRFKNLKLLNLAFCHRSFTNEFKGYCDNNERLEFLGDSILGLVIADYLFNHLPENPEGDLAKIKSYVVSEPALADKARKLEIPQFLLLGKGEDHSGGRDRDAILADAMEAVIGAFYLDNGLKPVSAFILNLLIPEIDKTLVGKHDKDYKTLLQEVVQKKFRECPKYHLIKTEGPDHEKTFFIEVRINNDVFGTGSGPSKKKAEQTAAEEAWNKLNQSS